MNEDIIKNWEREESIRRKDLYNKVGNAYTWKMQEKKINLPNVESIVNPIDKEMALIQHAEEILGDVPREIVEAELEAPTEELPLEHMSLDSRE